MRFLFGFAVFAIAAAFGQTAQAGRFCAVYSDGGQNCDFPSMWACRAAISGVGGSCNINPRAYSRAYSYVREPRGRRAYYRDEGPCGIYVGIVIPVRCY